MSTVTDERVLDDIDHDGMDDDGKRAAFIAMQLAVRDVDLAIAETLGIWRVCDRVNGRWRWK